MSGVKAKPQRTCPECVHDGGWHWTDDDERVAYRCPNYTAAAAAEQGMKLAAEAHRTQFLAAKEIVRDAAQRMGEFSANNLRDELEAAQIHDTQVIGAAFNALARSKDAPIVSTGRRVPSKLDSTNGHGILVWQSTVHKASAA